MTPGLKRPIFKRITIALLGLVCALIVADRANLPDMTTR